MSSRTTTGKIFSALAVAALLLGAGTAMGTGDGWWDGVGNPHGVGMFQVDSDHGGYLFDTPEVGIMTDTGTTQNQLFAWKDFQPMTKAEGWTVEFAFKLTGGFVSAYNFFTAFGDDTNEVNMWWRSDQAGLDLTPDGFVAMAELYDGDFHTIRVEREAGADEISISIDGDVRRIIEMPSAAAGDRALFSYYGSIGQWDYIKWSSPSATLFPPEPAGPRWRPGRPKRSPRDPKISFPEVVFHF